MIELVSEGVSVESILAGANRSVVARLIPMVVKYRPTVIVATGGCREKRSHPQNAGGTDRGGGYRSRRSTAKRGDRLLFIVDR